MKKVVSAIIAILLTIGCMTFVGCGKNKFTYWEPQGVESSDTNMLVNVAEVTYSSVKVSQVWINVSALRPNETVIHVDLFGSSSTAVKKLSYTLSKSAISASSKKQGWINIFNGLTEKTCTRAVIEIKDTLQFNEICLVNEKGELIELTFSKGGVKLDKSENIYTKEQLQELKKGDLAYSENPAYNIVDEQDKLPKEYIEELIQKD